MLEFHVSDMTCNHCVASVTRAVQAAVPGTTVSADLAAKRVRVDGASQADVVEQAIRAAGFDVKPA